MSDFDSDDAGAPTSPHKLEQALRDAANDIFKRDPDNLTLKRVRTTAEEKLELEDGWFKANSTWNTRSKEIVHKHVQKIEEDLEKRVTGHAPSSTPTATITNKESASPKKGAPQATKRGAKRSTPDTKPKPRKRRKVFESDVEDETGGGLGGVSKDEAQSKSKTKPQPETKKNGEKEPKGKRTKVSKANIVSKSEDNSVEEAELPKPAQPSEVSILPKKPVEANIKPDRAVVDDSSSELSSLPDEPPPKKKPRQKKPSSPRALKSESKPTKSKSKSAEPSDTNAEEIKRLQGWLVKCGIKKLWGKELAPYSTPREKIAHLKTMLRDAGMDGRYSVEKARQIKEARELAADLEAVKDFDERWGRKGAEEHDGAGTRKRGAARLLVHFSDDDDEESD